MIRFPGLIDCHVHLRDPGQTHKEDFYSGTAAALYGGYTSILDMPNNSIPITTEQILNKKLKIAKEKIVCDVGFYFGSLGENLDELKKVQHKVFGLKVYLNQTTGNYIVDEKVFENICKTWPINKPILVHAEENILEKILKIGERAGQKIHVCHVSSKSELQMIIKSKENGQKVTCGVTPHHLFLVKQDLKKLGPYGLMKPILKTKRDKDFLWKNLKYIDVIESDHAPHTKDEKESKNPPYGVPGLETTLPLLLTAMSEGKITKEEIIKKCYTNPKKIFHIPIQPKTYVEVDENKKWIIKNENLNTKCKWSPFNGWKVKGKITKVVIRGVTVLENNKLLAKGGSGHIITP